MRAGFAYFEAFERDAEQFEQLAKTKLTIPVFVIAGETSGGPFLEQQARRVATNVTGVVIQGSGHWLMDEQRTQTVKALVGFLDAPRTAQK